MWGQLLGAEWVAVGRGGGRCPERRPRCVPGSEPGVQRTGFHSRSPQRPCKVGIFMPVLRMRRPRLRDSRSHSNRVPEPGSPDSGAHPPRSPGSPLPEPQFPSCAGRLGILISRAVRMKCTCDQGLPETVPHVLLLGPRQGWWLMSPFSAYRGAPRLGPAGGPGGQGHSACLL